MERIKLITIVFTHLITFDFTQFTSIVIMVLWTNPLKILEYNLDQIQRKEPNLDGETNAQRCTGIE